VAPPVVVRGVPLPKNARTGVYAVDGVGRKLLASMEPGDSFLAPLREGEPVERCRHRLQALVTEPGTFAMRQELVDGRSVGFRVWRIK
jgi:hypothetical protein